MAAGEITINGADLPHIADAFATAEPTAGSYWMGQNPVDPRFNFTAPYAGAPDFDDRPIKFPGVAGTATRRFEFANRPIFAALAFIGASRAGAESELNDAIESWTQLARYTITLPGGETFQGCKMLPGSCSVVRNIVFQGGDIAILAMCEFVQMSTEN